MNRYVLKSFKLLGMGKYKRIVKKMCAIWGSLTDSPFSPKKLIKGPAFPIDNKHYQNTGFLCSPCSH